MKIITVISFFCSWYTYYTILFMILLSYIYVWNKLRKSRNCILMMGRITDFSISGLELNGCINIFHLWLLKNQVSRISLFNGDLVDKSITNCKNNTPIIDYMQALCTTSLFCLQAHFFRKKVYCTKKMFKTSICIHNYSTTFYFIPGPTNCQSK